MRRRPAPSRLAGRRARAGLVGRLIVPLLLLYPARFRHEYGDELVEVLAWRCRRERSRGGRLAGLVYALSAVLDLIGAGLRLRLGRSTPRPSPQRPEAPPGRKPRSMDRLAQDLKLATRGLAARPGFTLAAILSLALGIGANTAVFSMVDAVLLRTLPVEEPGELVVPLLVREGGYAHNFAHADFVDLRERSTRLADLAAYSPFPASLGLDGSSQRVAGLYASSGYFDLLGLQAAAGRLFGPADVEDPATAPAIVLSHGYWQRRFGGDPAVVGREATLNGTPVAVVGVAPEGFAGTYPGQSPDVWVPLAHQPDTVVGALSRFDLLGNRAGSWLYLVGRLAPGTSREAAEAELDGILEALAERYPDTNEDRTDVALVSGARGHHGALDDLTTPLVVLMGVVASLLLIACANVANLLLARAVGRSREIGVRQALGASRGHLVRQLLTESLVLAALGGLAGVGVAWLALDGLQAWLTAVGRAPVLPDARLDPGVLGFALGVSLFTGIVFGLAPALRGSRAQLREVIREEGRGATAGPELASQRLLVVVQVALSFALLVGATLLSRSVLELRSLDPGFEVEGVLLATLDTALAGHDDAGGVRVLSALRQRVEALPGVASASFARAVPVDPGGSRTTLWLPGRGEATEEEIDFNPVDHGYFRTMGIPLLRGRGFTPDDAAGAPPVAVVNETLARRLWPGEDPLGKRIGLYGPDAPQWEVVGVAADGKYRSLREEPRPYVYVSMRQVFRSDMTLVVRADVPPSTLAAAVRAEVEEVDPDLPVHDVRTLGDHVAATFHETRVTALLLSLFSVLGLALAGFGLYGVLAYAVRRRRREIGVRMALGARAASVIRLVLAQGMAMVAAGLVLGALLVLGAARFLGALLFEVRTHDPATVAVTAGFLATVAALACLAPAWRATRVDPVRALRDG